MKEPEDDILKQLGLNDDPDFQRAMKELQQLEVKPNLSHDEAWQKLEHSIMSDKKSNEVKPRILLHYTWRIAASVIILVSAWFGMNRWNNETIITGNKETKEIILPDQSKVTLNAASSMHYKRFMFSRSRNVDMTGEVFFNIIKGNAFKISTRNNTVCVLGTTFNVYSRSDHFEVQCLTGTVAVTVAGSKQVILNKRKAVRKDAGQSNISTYDVEPTAGSWMKGEFYFNNTDLNLVLDEIGRQFNITIIKSNLRRKYTGYFNKSDLKLALDNVCLPMGLSYKIINNTVIIQ